MSRQAHDFLMKPVSLIPVIDETGASILLKTVFRQQSDVWTATNIDNFLSFYVYCFHTGTAFVQFGRISCRTIVFVFFFTIFMETKMLYTIAIILFILWLLGLVTTNVLGGFVHLLLIAAVVVLLFGILSGRRSS